MDVTSGDRGRDPGDVARGLFAWQRGDADEAVALTLAFSAKEMNRSNYILWAWEGWTSAGEPAWALPVTAAQAATFAPRGPATALIRSLNAALEAGARPDAVRLEAWHGFTCIVAPGLDTEISRAALEEAHAGRGLARLALVPDEVRLDGTEFPLVADPAARGNGIIALGREVLLHPVTATLALWRHGLGREPIPSDPSDLVEALRDLGYAADLPVVAPSAPSLAIEDDACPRRRHARRVLRRLLQKGKIGGHHTEIDHFTRGLPDHEKRDAKEVVEALLRAGILVEKPSVGQRHISLNRESLPEIHALIERGETADPLLAALWTAPAPGAA